MQSHSAKQAEAEGYMRSAEKHLEKRMFHFKANYNGAAEDFDKAARIYTNLNHYPKARDAWTRASEAHSKAHNESSAANSMEKLGDYISRSLLDSESGVSSANSDCMTKMPSEQLVRDAIHSYEEASKLYDVATNASKQASTLKKAADLVSRFLSTQRYSGLSKNGAAEVNVTYLQTEYKRIAEDVIKVMERNWQSGESKPFDLHDVYTTYMLLCLRSGDVEGAVQTEKRMIGIVSTSPADGTYDDQKNLFRCLNQPSNAAKAGLEIIVLCLSTSVNDGYTWANMEMNRLGAVFGFCNSSEERAAATLLSAYAERDEDALQEALKANTCLGFLTPDVSKIAKKLTLGTKGYSKGAAALPSSSSPPGLVDASETDSDDLR